MTTAWQQFSNELSEIITSAGKSIVAVDARSGHTSSGIVWRRDAILTAAHAVRHENNIGIIFGPGQSAVARLAGRDRGTDIALLKLDQEIDMQPAACGSTESLAVGALGVAIGRTRRGNIVASSGIISGLMGEWRARGTQIDQFIRPDLNLYPGFSGGALLDPAGAILGLNTSGLLRGRPITIPSSTLLRIAEELAASGHVAKPYVGLVMQPVQIPESLQKKAGVDNQTGLLVMHVEPAGPADQAGVLLGDLLVAMDGHGFSELSDLSESLSGKAAGQEVQVSLIRGGQPLQLSIRIGNRPTR
ncbi:MAG TPA: S1C family serine protease [Terriglobia bacterium]|jgi:S1-C subfamily serine protease